MRIEERRLQSDGCDVMIDSRSSDESVDSDVDHVTAQSASTTSPRPPGQSSRPSSRQGQKYTATAAAAAAAGSPVVIGYRDGVLPNRKVSLTLQHSTMSFFVMVALCNRADHYIFIMFLLLLLLFSSPNLSSRRLDVYHTSTHGVVLV